MKLKLPMVNKMIDASLAELEFRNSRAESMKEIILFHNAEEELSRQLDKLFPDGIELALLQELLVSEKEFIYVLAGIPTPEAYERMILTLRQESSILREKMDDPKISDSPEFKNSLGEIINGIERKIDSILATSQKFVNA